MSCCISGRPVCPRSQRSELDLWCAAKWGPRAVQPGRQMDASFSWRQLFFQSSTFLLDSNRVEPDLEASSVVDRPAVFCPTKPLTNIRLCSPKARFFLSVPSQMQGRRE